jgi:type IV pilus assembly protein PilO
MATPAFLQNFIDGPKLPKVVLGAIGLVAIGGLGYFFLLSPAQDRVAVARSKIVAIDRELMQARAQVAELARFRREVAELEKRLTALKDRLPSEKETPGLYKTLSEAAHQSGLGVALFQPREPRPRDYVNEIPITVTAEGGYHQLGQFFERVARLPRVVTVGDLKVTGLTKSKSSLKADMTLATFQYRATAPAAAPAPAAKPGAPQPVPAPKPAAALPVTGEGRS